MSNLVKQETSFPTAQDFQMMKELGLMAIRSGFLPQSIKTPEQAVVIILKGRELGIPPMQAFSSISVISGKPTMSAELMLSMIYRNVPGAVINYTKTDANECVIEAKRPGGKPTIFRFTMEDARRANLVNKGPWVTYPAAMLRARCISAMARAMFSDALSGVVYTPEELGAVVDDEGTILDVPQESVSQITESQATDHQEPELYVAGDEVIQYGFNRGKKFRDVDMTELRKTQAYIESKKVETEAARHFLATYEAYLHELEVADRMRAL